jgi:hypothetical protein
MLLFGCVQRQRSVASSPLVADAGVLLDQERAQPELLEPHRDHEACLAGANCDGTSVYVLYHK